MSKQFRVSWSRINAWKTCRWQYRMSYELYLAPKIDVPALRDGRLYHECLSYIYQRMPDVEMKKLIAKVRRYGLEQDVAAKMIEYVSTYLRHIRRYKAQEPDQVLANEFPFEVQLDMARLNERLAVPYPGRVSFIGIIDLIALRRDRGEIWDHKLQSSQPSSSALDHPSISYPQIGIYSWASTFLGVSIRDFQLNIYAKRRKTNPNCRYPIHIDETELENWEDWLYVMISEIINLKERPKNLGSLACGWCSFRYACAKDQALGEKGLNMALEEAYEKKSYDGGMPKWKSEFPADVIKLLS